MNLKGGKPEKFGAIRSFFYDRMAQQRLEPIYSRIVSEVPITSRMLDIGCGPGA
jgi:hypothetical protein